MARSRLYPPSVDPGFPELPETPDGWTLTTFGGVLDVVERPVKLNADTTYRLVTAKRNRGGITLRGEMAGREILTKTQFETKEHDFLISRRQIIHGACGVVPSVLDGAVVSNEYSTLRTRPALLMEYLSHYSHTPYFQRACFHSSHGVDVEKMIFKVDEWLARDVAIPPLGEQRKISAILSSVDDAIEATRAVIDQIQVVKKALMAELLTRGLPGRHARFKQTEIGEVPEEWRVLSLGDLATLGSGTTPSRARADYFTREGGTAWVKTMDLTDGPLVQTDEKVSDLALEETSLTVYPVGTVLIAMYGGFAQIGRTGILQIPAATNQAICPIQVGNVASPNFIQVCLEALRPLWRNIAASSRKDPNITKQDVARFKVPVPGLGEQQIIYDMIASVADRWSIEEQKLWQLGQVRIALRSVLLTGEVRVTPDEAAA